MFKYKDNIFKKGYESFYKKNVSFKLNTIYLKKKCVSLPSLYSANMLDNQNIYS